MFHATLIIGGSFEKRHKKALEKTGLKLKPQADVLVINEKPSVGIAKVKTIEKFLSRKPLIFPQKTCYLPHAELLTVAAQNAFLKTLEEPPANSQIVLCSPGTDRLLETIVSRCHLIKISPNQLSSQGLTNQAQIFKKIKSASLGFRIKLAQENAESSEVAVSFCLKQLKWLQGNLDEDQQKTNLAQQLIQTIKYLQANVNPKLCLEQLFLHYPTSKKG
jgi:hypothetical protein